MMLCPENGELETKFVQMLGVITHYDIDGDKINATYNFAKNKTLRRQKPTEGELARYHLWFVSKKLTFKTL